MVSIRSGVGDPGEQMGDKEITVEEVFQSAPGSVTPENCLSNTPGQPLHGFNPLRGRGPRRTNGRQRDYGRGSVSIRSGVGDPGELPERHARATPAWFQSAQGSGTPENKWATKRLRSRKCFN